MSLNQEKVRINFQLPLTTLLEFEKVANKMGITKSALLRKWIAQTTTLHTTSTDDQTEKTNKSMFNFFADKELSDFINLRSNALGLNTSSYLRAVVEENLKAILPGNRITVKRTFIDT